MLKHSENLTHAQGHVARNIKYCVPPGALASDLNIKKKSLTNNKVVIHTSHIRCCDYLIPATQLNANRKGGIYVSKI